MARPDRRYSGAADRSDPPDFDSDAIAARDSRAVVLGWPRGPAGIVVSVGFRFGLRVRLRFGEQQRELAVPVRSAAGVCPDSQDPSALAALVARVTKAGKRPKISVTMPVVARPTRKSVPGELTTAWPLGSRMYMYTTTRR
jgi:hypothetical protein